MKYTTRKIYFAALFLIASLAHANPTYSVGAVKEPSVMTNYGLGVKASQALSRVVPKDWAIKIHPSTRLEGVLSWQPDEAWTNVISKWATQTQLSVVFDWDEKVLYIQPAGLGAELFATLSKEKAEYKTPLPDFGAKYVVQTHAKPGELFVYRETKSVNKPQARVIAQAIADRFGLHLMWMAPEYQLEGPVTLLGQNAAADADLLWRASGRNFSPATYEVVGNVLLAYSQGKRADAMAELALKRLENPDIRVGVEDTLQNGAEEVVADASRNRPGITAGEPRETPVNAPQEAADGELVFTIKEGQQVEVALARFARSIGYTFEWKVNGGFQAQRDMEFRGPRLAILLEPLVNGLGVSADVYTSDKHLVVRELEPKDY